MGVIKSATYGDAYSSTDVLSSVTNDAKSGKTAVKVDSSLVPMIDKLSDANKVELSNIEKREITDVAAQMCGSQDQVCLQIKTRELAEAKLKEKQAATTASTADLIAGKYLTVVCVDDSGRERKIKVPEGKEFDLSVCDGSVKKAKTPPLDLKSAMSPFRVAWNTAWSSGGYAILAFLYASSVLITWMTFRNSDSRLVAYGLTAASAIVPYSGFFLALVGTAVPEAYRVLRERYVQTQVAMAKNPLGNP